MIRVTQERDNVYTVKLDIVEINLLTQISQGYGLTKSTALSAVILKGFDTSVAILHEIAAHETRKREANDNEQKH